MEMKKILVIGIILLFIGVTVAPSINQNIAKASQEDEFIEVTTQACGIQGYGDTSVKLTREQYQNLEQYLVELRARLNQTSTREEAVPLFKDAVVELDKYGLLPRGMSVELAQRLVTGLNQNRYERLLNNRRQEIFPNCINVFCLLLGSATANPNSISFVIPISIFAATWFALNLLSIRTGAETLEKLLDVLSVPILIFGILNPFKVMNVVLNGGCSISLYSFGLKGAVNSNDVSLLLGYTGILIWGLETSYFLGFSLAVV